MPSQADNDQLLDTFTPEDFQSEDFQSENFQSEDLHPDLLPYVREDGPVGRMLHHPLIVQIMLPPGMHRMTNQMYAHKRQTIATALDQGAFERVMWLYERAYRIDALTTYGDQMRARDSAGYWRAVSRLWRDAEFPFEVMAKWRTVWDHPDSHQTMTDEERVALHAMGERFTVYRGGERRNLRSGLSWTTDSTKALWFARRYSPARPLVAQARVRREDVRAYLTGRNESEIVVLPERLTEIRERRVDADRVVP